VATVESDFKLGRVEKLEILEWQGEIEREKGTVIE
jgi:hypothetical protein